MVLRKHSDAATRRNDSDVGSSRNGAIALCLSLLMLEVKTKAPPDPYQDRTAYDKKVETIKASYWCWLLIYLREIKGPSVLFAFSPHF
jgi:hypothetical protein